MSVGWRYKLNLEVQSPESPQQPQKDTLLTFKNKPTIGLTQPTYNMDGDLNNPNKSITGLLRKPQTLRDTALTLKQTQAGKLKAHNPQQQTTSRLIRNMSPQLGFTDTCSKSRRKPIVDTNANKFAQQLHKFPTLNINLQLGNGKKNHQSPSANLLQKSKSAQNLGNFKVQQLNMENLVNGGPMERKLHVSPKIRSQLINEFFQNSKFELPGLPKKDFMIPSSSPININTNSRKIIMMSTKITTNPMSTVSTNPQININTSIKKDNTSTENSNTFNSNAYLKTTTTIAVTNTIPSVPVPPSTTNKPPTLAHRIARLEAPTSNSSTPPLKKSDFQVLKPLRKGQYGQVMLVQHKSSGFLCAMKVMSKAVIRSENYVNQIVRQLTIHSYINHRNIAPLYGYFYDDDNIYLLLEFCEGGQLYSLIKKKRKMEEREVSDIIRQVLDGLEYIHRLKIIHRDLKPENILFSSGVVKISDFGWAVFDSEGLRKTVSGSPLYYPPEIVKGEFYDEKIDLWNVGMMTYECLLGKIPFRIYSELDLDKIVSDEITFPEYVDVSEIAKEFILKTMRKNPEERMEIREMLRHKFIKTNEQVQKSEIEGQLQKILDR